jgi:hypothetical protein
MDHGIASSIPKSARTKTISFGGFRTLQGVYLCYFASLSVIGSLLLTR